MQESVAGARSEELGKTGMGIHQPPNCDVGEKAVQSRSRSRSMGIDVTIPNNNHDNNEAERKLELKCVRSADCTPILFSTRIVLVLAMF